MKCTCWNGCSLHPAASRWKGAFPRTFRSPGGPGAAQSPAAVAVWCGRACTELVGTRRGGESDPGTLGNVKLEKNCAEDLSCYGEGKSIALSPCVGTVKGTADGGRNGAIGFASWRKRRGSRTVLRSATRASLHQLFSVANGFVGHARGEGPELIFLSSLWKVYQDTSFQAIPPSPVVPIHVLRGIVARGPMHSTGCSDLPGPTSSAWTPEAAAGMDQCAEEGHSVLS